MASSSVDWVEHLNKRRINGHEKHKRHEKVWVFEAAFLESIADLGLDLMRGGLSLWGDEIDGGFETGEVVEGEIS
ncbi:MAG TPA: hypothetical protein VM008_07235 [Phycisphaerae bacterium]|nr:hypothetical protein [Phycisphaerae bacterium]